MYEFIDAKRSQFFLIVDLICSNLYNIYMHIKTQKYHLATLPLPVSK
jgi:hypothetical protein